MKRQLLNSESDYFEHAIITTAKTEIRMSDAFEIGFILQGSCHIRSCEKDVHIKTNDIFFFPSQVVYSIECRGKSLTYYQIRVYDTYLALFHSELPNIYYDTYHITRNDNQAVYDTICNYIASVLFLSVSDRSNRVLRQLTDINRILLAIEKEYNQGSPPKANRSDTENIRIKQILNIIMTHYREKLRLYDMSAMLGFHPQYFSAYFTSVFYEKYTDYLNRYRINQSLRDLLYSDKTLLDIALENGFLSSKSYCNSFKKYYGELPGVYRKKHRYTEKSEINQENATLIQKAGFLYDNYWQKKDIADEAMHYPKMREEYAPLSLELSMEQPDIIQTDSRIKMISIGSVFYILQDDVYNQLKALKENTRFTHVHMRDIFSDYLQIYTEPLPGMVMHFWGDLGRALDRIINLGFIPFIELGYMPSDLSSTEDRLSYSYHPHMGPPKDMKKWEELVHDFLSFCKEKYRETIYEWKFDFWNTANLNVKNGYWGGTQQEFFRLYKETWKVFQKVDRRLTIGTPSFSLPDGISWYEAFFDFCKKEGITPSHVSIHLYSCMDNLDEFAGIFPYPPTTYNYLSLTTREYINNLIYFVKRIVEKHHFEKLPIIASEWNITYYLSDLIRDTAFMATYIAHTYIQTIPFLAGLGFFCVSDINDQFRPSVLLFNGDEGIFTWQGIPKPAYHAFCLLHKLDPQVVAENNSSYIVTRGSRGFHILIYNMPEYDKLQKDQILSYTIPDQRYQVFTNTVPIQLHGIFHVKRGSYTVKTYTFDRKHGSFYDFWLQMGKPEQLTPEMVELLKRNSVPFLHYERCNDTSVIMLDETIFPHGITLFEIEMV